jgi:DNA-binding response OmpR family regulator
MSTDIARIPFSAGTGIPAVKADVVVVDDEEGAANEMAHYLANAGLNCLAISDPWDALRRLAHEDGPHVAVVDVRMPELNGLELVEHLNTFGIAKRPEVILVSGSVDLDDAILAMRLGVRRLLVKPLDLAELVREVKGVGVERELRARRSLAPLQSKEGGQQGPSINAMMALSRWRERIFPREMLSDHCWRMFLELYRLGRQGRSVSLTSLALVSGLSMATAIRRIHSMRNQGLVTYTADVNDRRRTFVRLSEAGARQIDLFLYEVEAEMSGKPRSLEGSPIAGLGN